MSDTAEDKVEELRGKLRDGRRASETSAGVVRHSEGSNGQARSSVQVIGRNNNPARTDGRINADNDRGSNEKPQRIRQGRRRSSHDDTSPADGNEQVTGTATRTGSLERIDEIPERIDNEIPAPIAQAAPIPIKRPVGRPRKEETPEKVKTPVFKRGVLSAGEAQGLQEPLAAALIDYGTYLDKALRMYTADPEMPDIWGDLTDLEASVIGRIMIRRGQRNAAAAELVRNMVEGSDYVNAAVVIVPRAMRTAQTMRAAAPRRGKGKRENTAQR